jgi:hypothetical protein
MSKLSVILVSVFILALGAGVLADRLALHLPAEATVSLEAAADHSFLSEQLQLTADQRSQMKQIWEAMREKSRECLGNAQTLQNQREEAIVKLLSKEQKNDYEQIGQDYQTKFQKLNEQRDAAFALAVDKTRKILSDTQRRKYEEILKERIGRVPGLNSAHGGPAFLNDAATTKDQP